MGRCTDAVRLRRHLLPPDRAQQSFVLVVVSPGAAVYCSTPHANADAGSAAACRPAVRRTPRRATFRATFQATFRAFTVTQDAEAFPGNSSAGYIDACTLTAGCMPWPGVSFFVRCRLSTSLSPSV